MSTKGGKTTENGGDRKQRLKEKQKRETISKKSLNTAKKWAGESVNGVTVLRQLCKEIEPCLNTKNRLPIFYSYSRP